MAKEQFSYAGTKDLCQLVDRAGNKAGFGRGQAFDDFLHVTVCALATGLMEEEYLATVRKGYDRGDQGTRGDRLLLPGLGPACKFDGRNAERHSWRPVSRAALRSVKPASFLPHRNSRN